MRLQLGVTEHELRRFATPESVTPVTGSVAPSNPGEGVWDVCDVFVAHASEDKETLVRPLAAQLSKAGLRVWYDETELRLGDSLRTSIDAGLQRARALVVVVSPALIKNANTWAGLELNAMLSQRPLKRVVPVWHGVQRTEVLNFSPLLGDLVGIESSRGIAAVAAQIVATIAFDRVPAVALPPISVPVATPVRTEVRVRVRVEPE